MKVSALPEKEPLVSPLRTSHSHPVEAMRRRIAPQTSIDQIMVEERAASFTKRSIKTSAKLAGLKMVVSMMDLTTLEGKDTPGKVAYLCRKALQPADPKYAVPSCAAVCVYPNMVKYARKFLGERTRLACSTSRLDSLKIPLIAAVATGFP